MSVKAAKLGRIERAILAIAPGWAESRARSRLRVAAYGNAYEAVNHSRLRKKQRDFGSGNTVAGLAHKQLRDLARNLDRNHDLSRGILNVLVRNVVGPNGIGVEPQPRDADGNVLTDLAKQLDELWQQWSRSPEVTGEFNRARYEQLVARSWFRDGECFWQYVEGSVPGLRHGTAAPFSLELLEADLVPVDYNDPIKQVIQGIEIDAWGRPRGYWMYKEHPGDPFVTLPVLKRLPTDAVGHIKLVDRLNTRRGVSMFASVLSRLDDLKDYEESERIAARIAASMAAFIKKGDAGSYDMDKPAGIRQMNFAPGMIFDDLLPGEEIGTIDSNRPNPNAVGWRDGQLRAVAGGTDVSYSSSSKNYGGTYSAQRQELVEQWTAYQLLQQAFIDMCTGEVYPRFVASCLAGGLIKPVKGVTFAQLSHAIYMPPVMPWIDPVKEVLGWQMQEDRCYIAGSEIVRRQGRNPADVIRAQSKWQADLRTADIRTQTAPNTQPGADPATAVDRSNNEATTDA
ncbi:MAG: phage portal protein [Rhodanobacter sp. 68-29]|nr:phage portal protein [Rhodanobacter sp.]ODV27890.1 MAG: phage portal protein [Rhodanobacter sp. SCN 68-63]OJY61399.1 MAG: phage portal protein [Rhodanobacter sp. 68-29]